MLDVDNAFKTGGKTYIKNLPKVDIITLVRYKVCAGPEVPAFDQLNIYTADELRATIYQKVCHRTTMTAIKSNMANFIQQLEAGIIDTNGSLVTKKSKKTRVLGADVLRNIRHDMEHTVRPSGAARPPANPGQQKWGKFTADQWRVFCVEVLPVTLTRLWGDEPAGSRNRDCLDNFMELVSAIKLATAYTMTHDRIVEYEAHMTRYLETLLILYPDVSITPYQHLALHFGPMLRRFGPTTAWRCFNFERYNFMMRQFPTNQRFGER